MAVHAAPASGVVPQNWSMDEWVLVLLQERGPQTLDGLGDSIPDQEKVRLFLAVDRLSRAGRVVIGPPKHGDYLIAAAPDGDPSPPMMILSSPIRNAARCKCRKEDHA